MIRTLLFIFVGLCSLFSEAFGERPMVIVIPSYNNREWYMINLQMVLRQGYSNYRIIYLNDCSTDGTGEGAATFARWVRPDGFRSFHFDNSSTDFQELSARFKQEINQEGKHFFTIVHNQNRSGALQNLYLAIHSCDDDEIIVTLDGDDWFADYEVLRRLNEVYSAGGVWLTHGKMIEYPSRYTGWCEPVPSEFIAANAVRRFKCPSHLRTFYAWLFKKIKLEDLLWQGKFFPMTWDMAIMYPMLEMAAERHRFIPSVNYVYNRYNSLNDEKVNIYLQRELDGYIRGMPPYQRLN